MGGRPQRWKGIVNTIMSRVHALKVTSLLVVTLNTWLIEVNYLEFFCVRNSSLWYFLFSHLVVYDSLQPHELQHARLPCPSLSPRVCSNSHPSNWWCHPTISSSVIPFSSCLRSFPASESLPVSQLSIRWPKYWSFSFTISPVNEHSGLIFFRTDWFDLPAVQGTLRSLLQHHNSKVSVLQHSALFMVQLRIHTWLLEKPYLWLDRPLFQSDISVF